MADPYEVAIARSGGKVHWWPAGDQDDLTGLADVVGARPLDNLSGSGARKGTRPLRTRSEGMTRKGRACYRTTNQATSLSSTSTVTIPANSMMVVTLQPDGVPSANRMGAGVEDGSNNRFFFTWRTASNMQFLLGPTGGLEAATPAASSVKLQVPHHIAILCTTTTWAAWIDGQLAHSEAYSGTMSETAVMSLLGRISLSMVGRGEHLHVITDAAAVRALNTASKAANHHKVWLKRHRRERSGMA